MLNFLLCIISIASWIFSVILYYRQKINEKNEVIKRMENINKELSVRIEILEEDLMYERRKCINVPVDSSKECYVE